MIAPPEQQEQTVNLTKRQTQIIEIIERRQPISVRDIAAELGITIDGTQSHLFTLRRVGRIEATSYGRYNRWKIAPYRHYFAPLEQVPSVWHYAARCARERWVRA